jgi:hypothetical protein
MFVLFAFSRQLIDILFRFKGPELYTLGEKPRLLRSLSGAFDDYVSFSSDKPNWSGEIL